MKKTIMMPDYWVECLYGEGTGLWWNHTNL